MTVTLSTSSRGSQIKRLVKEHPQFMMIVFVFLIFRLLLPFGFTSLGPDISDYLRWGALADSHLYPYVNYWSEYPPLFSWSVIGLYRLSTLIPAWQNDPPFWFSVILRTTMTLFDLGSLTLVYSTALRIGHKSKAIRVAALFAGGFVTVYAASSWYDAVPLFFLLLALYLALRDRPMWSAIAVATGFMIKVVPIVIVPAVLRRLTRFRDRAAYTIATSVMTLGLMLPFLIVGWPYLIAFFNGIFSRPSWNSIWAILDGGYSFGAIIPLSDRFSPQNIGTTTPSSLPWPIIHLAFAGLFLFLYTRRINWRDPITSIAFVGLTVNLFLLWSKGFSGQFTDYVFPFIVLLMPNFRGLIYAGLLSVLWIAEWPMALLTVTDVAQKPNAYMTWLIITRTIVLIALCLEYARMLFPRLPRIISRVATVSVVAGWIGLLPAGISLITSYSQTQLAADPVAPAINLIANSQMNIKTIVFASSRTFRRLYPLAYTLGDTLLLPPANLSPEDVRATWLNDLASQGPFWLIADEGDNAETRDESRTADAWTSDHACKVDLQWAGTAKVSRFVETNSLPIQIKTTATFADEVELNGIRLSAQTIQSRGTLCIEFDWQIVKAPAGDYTVFVHLVNAQGQIVSQNDLPPLGGFALTSQWKVGSNIKDKHGLILPETLPTSEYTLQAGLYRSDNQSPVHITQGKSLTPDSLGVILTKVNVTVIP